MKMTYKIGDKIEVIDERHFRGFMRGEIIALDDHPLEYGEAKIRLIDSVSLSAPELWVSLRHARLLNSQTSGVRK